MPIFLISTKFYENKLPRISARCPKHFLLSKQCHTLILMLLTTETLFLILTFHNLAPQKSSEVHEQAVEVTLYNSYICV